MKKETLAKLIELAEQDKQEKLKDNCFDEVEIAMIPVIICKKDGKVACVTDGNIRDVFRLINKEA